MPNAPYALLMATPVIISRVGCSGLRRLAPSKKISPAETSPPAMASTGNISAMPRCELKNAAYSVTNRPDPALTPSVPGEARSLCSRSCMITPDMPMPRPTIAARHSRGRRNSISTSCAVGEPLPSSVQNTSSGATRYCPVLQPSRNTAASSASNQRLRYTPRRSGDTFSLF